MVIGERLRAIREEKNMSQGDIEHSTGLLRCYISRVENGHTIPSVETLEKLSRAMGVTMGQLFSGDGKEPEPLDLPKKKTEPINRRTKNGLRLVAAAFQKMNAKDQALLIGFAKQLASRR